MSLVLRDTFIPKCSDTSIRNAISANSDYNGYRWVFLNSDLPDNTIQELEETVSIKKPRREPIAQINKDRTSITNVYRDAATAQKENKIGKKAGKVATIISNQELWNGNYYMYWSDCTKELQDTWREDLPPPKIPHQQLIQRVDIKTGNILQTYYSMSDVTRSYPMAHRTLKKMITIKKEYKDKNGKLHGFIFKYVDKVVDI
jgi:hypothetical protein